jgi:hypothetical protein
MARCVEAEEVGVERAAAVRLGGRRRSVEEHDAHGARHVGLVVDSAPVGVGISVAAGFDKLHEPLAVQLPRRVRSARYRPQVDDAEDFADLLSPRSKLVGEDMLNVRRSGGASVISSVTGCTDERLPVTAGSRSRGRRK